MKHGWTQWGWFSAGVITPQLNKQFVVIFLEWLTNDLLVVVLSEPPWAIWGLIYMIICCFDDTLVIISRLELQWKMIWVWLACAQSVKEKLLKKSLVRLCSCRQKCTSLSVHDIAPPASLCLHSSAPLSRLITVISPQTPTPSMPHSPGRSLIRTSRPQPAPSLEWAWWWRSIRLSQGLYIQEADLAQSATNSRRFPGKTEVKMVDQSGEQGSQWEWCFIATKKKTFSK